MRTNELKELQHEIALENIDRHFENMILSRDKDEKEKQVNFPPNSKKYQILLKCFNVTINEFNQMTERYSDCKILRTGKVIDFEGTQDAFDSLLDGLYKDESNFKVIDYITIK